MKSNPDDELSIVEMCSELWDLLPQDRYVLPREAHLTKRERTAWGFTMAGHPLEIDLFDYVAAQMGITPGSARRLIRQAALKIALTSFIGWFCAYMEDVHRHGYKSPRQDSLRLVK